jgi:hypothetical protein
MQRMFLSASAVLGIVVFCSPAAALAQAQPTRHLVYNFSVGIKQDSVQENNEMATGAETSDLGGSNSDKGQIMVDVSGVEPDGGLVVIVSEAARGNHSAKPVTCVVYPDTSEVCGAGDVHPEETVVLRTLSPKFFDASNLDANHHWQVANAGAGVKIDFTANPGADGVSVAITAERVQKATNGNTEVANAKYAYDTTKLIPTSLSEYQTLRQQNGAGAYSTTVIDTTATLASDSGLAKS